MSIIDVFKNKKMINKKGNVAIIAIGITVLIAVIIGGILYLQSKSEVTESVVSTSSNTQPANQQNPTQQQIAASTQNNSQSQPAASQSVTTQPQVSTSTNCPLPPKEGYVRINGKVNFPKGIKDTEKYKVAVKITNKFPLASDGSFCAYADKYTSMLSVSSGMATDFPLIYFVVGNKDKDIVVDAQSTAVGMVYTSGVILLATDDSNKAIADLVKIGNNASVKKLAQEIQNKDVLSSSDIDSGSISTAFEIASKSAITEITSGK
jgi:hypothetical protein